MTIATTGSLCSSLCKNESILPRRRKQQRGCALLPEEGAAAVVTEVAHADLNTNLHDISSSTRYNHRQL